MIVEPERLAGPWRTAATVIVADDQAEKVAARALPHREDVFLVGQQPELLSAWSAPLAARVIPLPEGAAGWGRWCCVRAAVGRGASGGRARRLGRSRGLYSRRSSGSAECRRRSFRCGAGRCRSAGGRHRPAVGRRTRPGLAVAAPQHRRRATRRPARLPAGSRRGVGGVDGPGCRTRPGARWPALVGSLRSWHSMVVLDPGRSGASALGNRCGCPPTSSSGWPAPFAGWPRRGNCWPPPTWSGPNWWCGAAGIAAVIVGGGGVGPSGGGRTARRTGVGCRC